jgi:membrane-associated protein
VTLNDQLLAAMSTYGLPALFVIVMITSIGFPLPSTFALIAAGSFVQLGYMNMSWVLGLGVTAALLGDQIGYAIGRFGGRRLALRVGGWFGGGQRLHEAEIFARKWGALGIFFSRWLITPLSPWLNIVSGITAYSYPRFLVWDIPGEIIWVVLYVMVGKLFSDRVQAVTEMLGSLGWALVGLIAAVLFGWALVRRIRMARK